MALILLLSSGTAARAFKVDTHVWIAQQVINDLADDGRLSIGDAEYELRPELLEALLRNQDAYRLGSIGPDGFPDMVGGQMTTHPGLASKAGGWVTDDWLRWVSGQARSPEQKAFAYGYLTHAAGDVFSHTYVNTYAGDAFELEGEQEVELRHMVLENFILEHQPPLRDFAGAELYDARRVALSDELAIWLADTLILNEEVARQYGLVDAGATAHLRMMYDYLGLIDGIIADAREAESSLEAGLDSLESRIAGLKRKKVKVRLWVFGSVKVKLWPWYCFVDPASCLAIATVSGHIEATRRLLDLTVDEGLKPLIDWREQIHAAVVAYCRASQAVAVEILRDKNDHQRPPYPAERDPARPIKEWAVCWAPTFAGLPAEATGSICAAQKGLAGLRTLKERYQSLERDLTGKLGDFEWILAPHNAASRVRTRLTEMLKDEFARLGQDIAGEDSVLYDVIELRRTSDLVEVFKADSSDKGLLVLPDIKERIMADMGIQDESQVWDPDEYAVIAHSITLSKLLLLDPAELNRLALAAGVNCSVYGTSPFVSEPDFNLLFGWIRSIDGNHQWQPYALPYMRSGEPGVDPRHPEERHFGYYLGEMARSSVSGFAAQPGFRFWQDKGLRERVFLRLFDRPLLARDLLPEGHPDRATDDNPFPPSRDDARGNVIHAAGDCVNTYVLVSATESDLIFQLPDPPGCMPSMRTARNIRYRWDFIEDFVFRWTADLPLAEALELDRSASRVWTGKDLLGRAKTFEGSLDELASTTAKNSIAWRETREYEEALGRLVVSFHVRRSGYGFSVGSSEATSFPEDNLVDLKGNFICYPRSARPTFIKGPADDLLLQATVTWEDGRVGTMSCFERYRIVESRDPSLAHLDSYRDLSHLGTPCAMTPTLVKPASNIDLLLLRTIKDDRPPVFAGVRDLDLGFRDKHWRRQDLAVPVVFDDWHRSAELTLRNDAPDEFPLGTTVVHWTAVDPTGNLTTVEQLITVEDREPPRFVAATPEVSPARWETEASYPLGIVEIELEHADGIPSRRLAPPAAVDNHPGEVSVFLENPEESYALGESVVTWVARDEAGNETRARQLVRVTGRPGDTDLDGDVDEDDAAHIASSLGERALGREQVLLADFNEDGVVDTLDERLRAEIQAHIDSLAVDLRDLNADGWITSEDLGTVRNLMTTEAGYDWSSDFLQLPPQLALFGDARWEQERLLLSTSQTGSVIIGPASQLRKVIGMEVSFTISYAWRGLPFAGEGVSFSFAPDLPESAFGEAGAGTGLRISLDLGVSRLDPARTMQVWFRDRLLGTSHELDWLAGTTLPLEFVLSVKPDGAISVWLNNDSEHLVFDRLTGYEPLAGRFGIGARSSRDRSATQWIDDLNLQATYEPAPSRPRLGIAARSDGGLELRLHGTVGRRYRIEVSSDLRHWTSWRQATIPEGQTGLNLAPVGDLSERARFYRAVGE